MSGKAPDHGEEAHDAIQDSNTMAQAGIMDRCISTEKHRTHRLVKSLTEVS